MNKSTIEDGQPEQVNNNEQKADNRQVSPSIANANVVGSLFGQREIKFRIWFSEWKRMFYKGEGENYDPVIHLNGSLSGVSTVQKYILMQYTGLKDRKGKEIYEGDKTIRGYVIMWSKKYGLFCEHFYQPFYNSWSEASYPIFTEGIEIIGNVFENPELLQALR